MYFRGATTRGRVRVVVTGRDKGAKEEVAAEVAARADAEKLWDKYDYLLCRYNANNAALAAQHAAAMHAKGTYHDPEAQAGENPEQHAPGWMPGSKPAGLGWCPQVKLDDGGWVPCVEKDSKGHCWMAGCEMPSDECSKKSEG